MSGNTNWDYAQMSIMAKEHGGPEMFVRMLQDSSYSLGQQSMYPLIGIAAAIGGSVAAGVMSLIARNKEKKLIAEMQVKEASEQLIKGIRDHEVKPAKDDEGLKDGEVNPDSKDTTDEESVN